MAFVRSAPRSLRGAAGLDIEGAALLAGWYRIRVTDARLPHNVRAVASLVLAVGMVLGSVVPVEMPCAAVCPCDGPIGADPHAAESTDALHTTAVALGEGRADEHESGEPCDDDCPDDCPSCGGAAVGLVASALGMPARRGTWRAVSAAIVRDTVHRSASSSVFRPPRRLG